MPFVGNWISRDARWDARCVFFFFLGGGISKLGGYYGDGPLSGVSAVLDSVGSETDTPDLCAVWGILSMYIYIYIYMCTIYVYIVNMNIYVHTSSLCMVVSVFQTMHLECLESA